MTEEIFRSQIKREIENRLRPESSTIPNERGPVRGPEAFSVPCRIQDGNRHARGYYQSRYVLPKQETKKHKDYKPQSPKARRKLNLEEYSGESEGAKKANREEFTGNSSKSQTSVSQGEAKQKDQAAMFPAHNGDMDYSRVTVGPQHCGLAIQEEDSKQKLKSETSHVKVCMLKSISKFKIPVRIDNSLVEAAIDSAAEVYQSFPIPPKYFKMYTLTQQVVIYP